MAAVDGADGEVAAARDAMVADDHDGAAGAGPAATGTAFAADDGEVKPEAIGVAVDRASANDTRARGRLGAMIAAAEAAVGGARQAAMRGVVRCLDGTTTTPAAAGVATPTTTEQALAPMDDTPPLLDGRTALQTVVDLIGRDEWARVRGLLFHALAGVTPGALRYTGGHRAPASTPSGATATKDPSTHASDDGDDNDDDDDDDDAAKREGEVAGAATEDHDNDDAALVESVVERYFESTPVAAWESADGAVELGAVVAAVGAVAARRPHMAAAWLLPVLTALLRVLSELQDASSEQSMASAPHHPPHHVHPDTLLRCLSLANTLLDYAPAAPHLPDEVVEELASRLARLRAGGDPAESPARAPSDGGPGDAEACGAGLRLCAAAAAEAALLSGRLADAGAGRGIPTVNQPPPSPGVAAGGDRKRVGSTSPSEGEGGGDKAPGSPPTGGPQQPAGRSYTETEVKSFLYQRKLEWEGQLRKRDRALAAKTAEVDTAQQQLQKLQATVASLTEQLAAKDAECTGLKETVDGLHQRNIETENKLEECNIFLREREHQVTILEGKNNTLQKEIAVLGNESRVLVANNKELEAYVAELIEKVA